MLVIIGMGLAIGFNVDSIAIYKILAHNDKARDQLVQLAVKRYQDYGKIIDTLKSLKAHGDTSQQSNIQAVQSVQDTALNRINHAIQNDAAATQDILGLGRCKDSVDTQCRQRVLDSLHRICAARTPTNKDWDDLEKMRAACTTCSSNNEYQSDNGFVVFIGWLITSLAISLGAPFWFDLLNKIMALRSAGTKPPTNSNSRSKGLNSPPVNPVG